MLRAKVGSISDKSKMQRLGKIAASICHGGDFIPLRRVPSPMERATRALARISFGLLTLSEGISTLPWRDRKSTGANHDRNSHYRKRGQFGTQLPDEKSGEK